MLIIRRIALVTILIFAAAIVRSLTPHLTTSGGIVLLAACTVLVLMISLTVHYAERIELNRT